MNGLIFVFLAAIPVILAYLFFGLVAMVESIFCFLRKR